MTDAFAFIDAHPGGRSAITLTQGNIGLHAGIYYRAEAADAATQAWIDSEEP